MSKLLFNKLLAMTVLAVLSFAGMAFAQSQASTGQITGTVSDPNGAVIPNATVTLTSKATNQTQTATTGSDGVYKFVLLQPGV